MSDRAEVGAFGIEDSACTTYEERPRDLARTQRLFDEANTRLRDQA